VRPLKKLSGKLSDLADREMAVKNDLCMLRTKKPGLPPFAPVAVVDYISGE